MVNSSDSGALHEKSAIAWVGRTHLFGGGSELVVGNEFDRPARTVNWLSIAPSCCDRGLVDADPASFSGCPRHPRNHNLELSSSQCC
jgi:hypothetical protein